MSVTPEQVAEYVRKKVKKLTDENKALKEQIAKLTKKKQKKKVILTVDTLSERQLEVYNVIKKFSNSDVHYICAQTGKTPNAISPRLKELREAGLIEITGKITGKLGAACSTYSIT